MNSIIELTEYKNAGERMNRSEKTKMLTNGTTWSGFLAGLYLFTDDFMSEARTQNAMQEREVLGDICLMLVTNNIREFFRAEGHSRENRVEE